MLSAVRHEIMMQLESLLLEARVCTSSNSYASFKLPPNLLMHTKEKNNQLFGPSIMMLSTAPAKLQDQFKACMLLLHQLW